MLLLLLTVPDCDTLNSWKRQHLPLTLFWIQTVDALHNCRRFLVLQGTLFWFLSGSSVFNFNRRTYSLFKITQRHSGLFTALLLAPFFSPDRAEPCQQSVMVCCFTPRRKEWIQYALYFCLKEIPQQDKVRAALVSYDTFKNAYLLVFTFTRANSWF